MTVGTSSGAGTLGGDTADGELGEETVAGGNAIEETGELVRGYRNFSIVITREVGGGLLIRLRGSHTMFWPSKHLVAECLDTGIALTNPMEIAESQLRAKLHLSKDTCACGIYSYREPSTPRISHYTNRHRLVCTKGTRAMAALGHGSTVIVTAEVVNWGFGVLGDMGYRTEHCELERLTVLRPSKGCDFGHEAALLAIGDPTVPHNEHSTLLMWACAGYPASTLSTDTLESILTNELTKRYDVPVNIGEPPWAT